MIERFDGARVMVRPEGAFVTNCRAVLECGCSMWIGYFGEEPGIGATACSEEHVPLAQDAIERYRRSLENPTDRPADEVADELLLEAEAAHA